MTYQELLDRFEEFKAFANNINRKYNINVGVCFNVISGLDLNKLEQLLDNKLFTKSEDQLNDMSIKEKVLEVIPDAFPEIIDFF